MAGRFPGAGPKPATEGFTKLLIVGDEKREQVFISSTYLDLRVERQEVIQTLLEADCIPSGMELFPASDDERWVLIRRVIDDCDYYIVIIGGRYGSVDPGKGLSYTEMEFDYAADQGKPIMAFLHGEPGKLSLDDSELDPEGRAKLVAFREKVSERIVKYWLDASQLGGQVAKSLIQIRKTHPAEGWVRARNAMTLEHELEMADLRSQVADLSVELAQLRKPVVDDPEALAQGSDSYMLMGRLTYTPVGAPRYQTQTVYIELLTNWDDIFASIGPNMMDEASENALAKQLNTMYIECLIEQLDGTDRPEDYGETQSAKCEPHVLSDVKIQLYALGLIEKSDRRRAVADSNAYWSLTEMGQMRLMSIRAIRKRPTDEPPAAGTPPALGAGS